MYAAGWLTVRLAGCLSGRGSVREQVTQIEERAEEKLQKLQQTSQSRRQNRMLYADWLHSLRVCCSKKGDPRRDDDYVRVDNTMDEDRGRVVSMR